MLKEGVKGTQEIMVTEENTAKVMGSGALDVFATPAMIALMEKTAWTSVAEGLDEGCGECTAVFRGGKRNGRNVNECKTCGSFPGGHENYL